MVYMFVYAVKCKKGVVCSFSISSLFHIGLLESAAIVLMVGGAAILLIGFLGCCGAFKQSQCLLCLVCFLLITYKTEDYSELLSK